MRKAVGYILILVFLFSYGVPCLASEPDLDLSLEDKEVPWLSPQRCFFLDCGKSFLGLATEPLRWGEEEWRKACALGVVTASVLCVDQEIFDFVQDLKNEKTALVADLVRLVGEGEYVFPALGGLYVYGYCTDREEIKDLVCFAGESYIVSGLLVHCLKLVFHRHRPYSGQGPYKWEGPSLSGQNLSFPSGHAVVAMSLATAISETYKEDYPLVPYFAYGIASMTALSRVHDQRHWPSDVLFASVLGVAVGKTITNPEWRRAKNLYIRPDLSKGAGISCGFTF